MTECFQKIDAAIVESNAKRRNVRLCNNDKNPIYLERQCLRDGAKALILLGFLDGNVEFTPYLHLWKIGSV